MSTPKGRGFYFAAECQELLSQDHAVPISDSTITRAIQPPAWWDGQKHNTGTLKADISPPSHVWEIDIASFEEYRQSFQARARKPAQKPRIEGVAPNSILTIAEAADEEGILRSEMHRRVYSGEVPYIAHGGFRFIVRK